MTPYCPALNPDPLLIYPYFCTCSALRFILSPSCSTQNWILCSPVPNSEPAPPYPAFLRCPALNPGSCAALSFIMILYCSAHAGGIRPAPTWPAQDAAEKIPSRSANSLRSLGDATSVMSSVRAIWFCNAEPIPIRALLGPQLPMPISNQQPTIY